MSDLDLRRSVLDELPRTVLSRGGARNPDVFLVETPDRAIVVKDFAARGPLVRRLLAPWLLRREAAAYHELSGVAAVPRLIGWVDELAFALEYRPGVLLSRSLAGRLPDAFIAELEGSIEKMHRLGIVHLDLRHRSNILAGDDGHPVLIDFASALRFDTRTKPGRAAFALFAWIDRRALEKWRVRIG